MKSNKTSSADILKDLEDIYQMAMANENFSVALKAKELLGRECGLFGLKKKDTISLSDLSDEDIASLIQELEKELTLDHSESAE